MLGVDKDSSQLKLWGANVPTGRAVLATLGKGYDLVELPPPSASLHVHASPPCTDLSPARSKRSAADMDAGLDILQWTMELIIKRGDCSWSIDSVSTPSTRELLKEYVTRFPDRVAFATLDAADFGAAQTRSRLIAGPPRLVKLLEEMPSAPRISIKAAFAARGLEVPTGFVKNQTKNRDGTVCKRSVEEQSFTVCASHALTWCDRAGDTYKVMRPCESATLMGFGPDWRLPTGSRNAQRGIGNALCVDMARAIMKAAISLQQPVSTPISTPPRGLPITPEQSTSSAVVVDAAPSDEHLHKRLRLISAALEDIINSRDG